MPDRRADDSAVDHHAPADAYAGRSDAEIGTVDRGKSREEKREYFTIYSIGRL